MFGTQGGANQALVDVASLLGALAVLLCTAGIYCGDCDSSLGMSTCLERLDMGAYALTYDGGDA